MSILCCFGCLTLTGLRNRVCQKLVYFPPAPRYIVESNPESADSKAKTMWLLDAQDVKCEPHSSVDFHLDYLTTRRRQRIATMYIHRPGAITTIIFSHGNATDIGIMRNHLLDVSQNLNVSICAYDYSGYGRSSGKPTPANTFADIDAVYAYVRTKFAPRFIVAYGQSLGSGPTLYLGKKNPAHISGIVIHSGLMSGLRVLKPLDVTKWFDIYPNVDNMRCCRAPALVIHGVDDADVPINHGIALSEASPNPYPPWFVEGGGHNNLEVHWRHEYFVHLGQFIRDIESGKASILAEGEHRRTKVAIPPSLELRKRDRSSSSSASLVQPMVNDGYPDGVV